jgi:choline dehydrogenase-like flavoprotein
MRLFLDAGVSGGAIGERLAAAGHDVRAVDREPELDTLDDDELLAEANADERVLVTSDVADFPDVLREWGMAGRAHAGVILLHGLEDDDFGLVVQGIQRWLRRHPELEEWRDRSVVLTREQAARVGRFGEPRLGGDPTWRPGEGGA